MEMMVSKCFFLIGVEPTTNGDLLGILASMSQVDLSRKETTPSELVASARPRGVHRHPLKFYGIMLNKVVPVLVCKLPPLPDISTVNPSSATSLHQLGDSHGSCFLPQLNFRLTLQINPNDFHRR